MNSFQRNVIALIKNALYFEKPQLEEPINWEGIVTLAKSHYISSLIYCATINIKPALPKTLLNELETAAMSHAIKEEQQLYELSRIEEEFNAEGISYMLLKGINTRKIYPKNVIRCMKDLDILIKTEQYDQIKSIMKKLGFKEGKETYHEIIWAKGKVKIELHKTIESPFNKDFYAYFEDGWKFAKREESTSSRYIMNKEDEFSFILTHFAGHYRRSGIGILHFLDLWLYLENNRDMNAEYLEKVLKELGLLDFYKNILKTLNVWFASGEEDDVTKLITKKIFSKGNLGETRIEAISDAARYARLNKGVKNTRLRSVARVLFPALMHMRIRHPILRKAPFLLPAVWVLRWFDILLFKKEAIAKKQTEMRSQTKENITKYLNELETVGLDFKE